MRFHPIDWALLTLFTTIVFAVMRVGMGLLTALGRPEPLPFIVAGVSFFVLNAYATWVVLRNCLDGLTLGRWLWADLLGRLMALVLWSLPLAVPPGPTAPSHSWLATTIASVAYHLPPGLLLQRLSGANPWPFVVAGVVSGQVSSLLGLTGAAPEPLGLVWGLAMGIGQGAISGLALGGGLFLMARQSARTRSRA
jgi:hypothetical protein